MAHYTIIHTQNGNINTDASAQAISQGWSFEAGDTCKYWCTVEGEEAPPSGGIAIGEYTYAYGTSGSIWELNQYLIHQGSGTSFLQDANNFKSLAGISEFINGNKAYYVNSFDGASIIDYYLYNKFAWYKFFKEEVTFASLVPGSAADFRLDLNSNFNHVEQYEEHIQYNIQALRDSLKDIAYTGKAIDLTEDSNHLLVSTDEKSRWNNRIWVETDEAERPIIYVGIPNTANKQDISQIVSGLIANQLPTRTSLLTNDSGYVTRSAINDTSLLYGTNIELKRNNFSLDSTTYPDLFTHKCDIDLSNWEQVHINREPTIIFSHSDVVDPDKKLSTTCSWDDSTGHLYFWCNEFWAGYPALQTVVMTIPVVVAVAPNAIVQ